SSLKHDVSCTRRLFGAQFPVESETEMDNRRKVLRIVGVIGLVLAIFASFKVGAFIYDWQHPLNAAPVAAAPVSDGTGQAPAQAPAISEPPTSHAPPATQAPPATSEPQAAGSGECSKGGEYLWTHLAVCGWPGSSNTGPKLSECPGGK